MKTFSIGRRCFFAGLLAAALFPGAVTVPAEETIGPAGLMPELSGWAKAEDVQAYFPESLFEYINGAAESYLAYDFRELAVGQYEQEGLPGSLTVEIYDMGAPRNAFGIYGTERYPESWFLPVGVQGYVEDELLNFLVGRYYVKLMCYDCGPETESVLMSVARAVAEKAGDGSGFPAVLAAFPRNGLVANSERFVLRNFLGRSFLEAGYTALYRREEGEFECFIVEGRSDEEAETMLRRMVEPVGAASLPGMEAAYGWRDRYLGNVFVLRTGHFLCGMMRVPETLADSARYDLAEIVRGLTPAER